MRIEKLVYKTFKTIRRGTRLSPPFGHTRYLDGTGALYINVVGERVRGEHRHVVAPLNGTLRALARGRVPEPRAPQRWGRVAWIVRVGDDRAFLVDWLVLLMARARVQKQTSSAAREGKGPPPA